jgi:ABC-type transport system involved in multi-copper enzyme maturation permease subunit
MLLNERSTSENIKIYTSLQADNIFKFRLKWFADFSGIILVFGSFLAFLFGFESFLFNGYLKLLSSLAGWRRVFLNIVLSRAVMLILFFFTSLMLAYGLIALNGIDIPLSWSLPVFFITIVSTALCFFVLGAFLGLSKIKWIGLVLGIMVWFLSIFIAPLAIELIISRTSTNIESVYELELKKARIFNDNQRKLKEKHGSLPLSDIPTTERLKDWKSFFNHEYQEIQSINEKIIKKIEKKKNFHQLLSTFFPTSNYLTICNELSGNGYESFLEFYRLNKKVKVDFFINYLKIVAENPNQKVEPFLKGDGNIYKGVSVVPGMFPWGMAIAFIYSFFFLVGTHRKFKMNLFSLTPNEVHERYEDDLFLAYGNITAVAIFDDRFLDHIFCLLSNHGGELKKKGFDYSVFLGENELVDLKAPLSFIYLVARDKLPGDIKTGHFLSFLMRLANVGKDGRKQLLNEPGLSGMLSKSLRKLDNDEFGIVLTEIMNTGVFKIVVIADAVKYVSFGVAAKLKRAMNKLIAGKDALVIHAILPNTLLRHNGDALLFSQQEELNRILDRIVEHTPVEIKLEINIDTIEKLLQLMEKSSYARLSILLYATKLMADEGDIIRNLLKDSPSKKD